jgi:FAD/FMN-containing dehydrogenase
MDRIIFVKNCILFVILAIVIDQTLYGFYNCQYQCSTDPLQQIYPNQNMCQLLNGIPVELQNLPYVMYPNCDIYNTNRFGYNKRFNVFPYGIIVPDRVDQVTYVLQILKKYNLPFAVRSGGHCYGPGSLSLGYIIDLRNFNSIIPDIPNQRAYIGAGCRLGQVIETLGALNYAIPTGTCPSVGITGLALGGGIGFLARAYGLTCDAIVSITLMTADGTIIEVNQQNHPNLFWALRGAGATAFGIALGFTFKMEYIPVVSFLTLTWAWDPKRIPAIFNAWQQWITTLPDTITTELDFRYTNGQSQVSVEALKVGTEPFTEWQAPFGHLNPIVKLYQGNYLGAVDLFASTYTMPFSKVKSKFLMAPLAEAGIKIVINFFSQLQETACNHLVFFSFGSTYGGAISRGDTAYFPRHAFASLYQFIYWQYEYQSDGSLNLIRQAYRDIAPYTSEYSYANLVDYDLGANYLHAYYGNHIRRLIHVKNIYDPTNVFTWNQAIPLEYTLQSNLSENIQQKYCPKVNLKSLKSGASC